MSASDFHGDVEAETEALFDDRPLPRKNGRKPRASNRHRQSCETRLLARADRRPVFRGQPHSREQPRSLVFWLTNEITPHPVLRARLRSG
jgi:hypothetical protein